MPTVPFLPSFFVASTLWAFAAGGLTGCTQTPDYFPPCVQNAPCTPYDASSDAAPPADASDGGAADAVEAP